jgi:hypothetical protein
MDDYEKQDDSTPESGSPALHEVLRWARAGYRCKDEPDILYLVFDNEEDAAEALPVLSDYIPPETEIEQDTFDVLLDEARKEIETYHLLRCPLQSAPKELQEEGVADFESGEPDPILLAAGELNMKIIEVQSQQEAHDKVAEWLQDNNLQMLMYPYRPMACYIMENDPEVLGLIYSATDRERMQFAMREFQEKYKLDRPLEEIPFEGNLCGFCLPLTIEDIENGEKFVPEEVDILLEEGREGLIPLVEHVKDAKDLIKKLGRAELASGKANDRMAPEFVVKSIIKQGGILDPDGLGFSYN